MGKRSDEKQRPPSGLSPWACEVWRELGDLNDFERHEALVFERALRWWDRSDALLAQADAVDVDLTPPARAALLKGAMDAAASALRHWRLLKWPADAVRRPGRPAGTDWSATRKAAMEAR